MRRLVIADAHVGQRPGDAEVMARLVESLPRHGIGEVVYLGDAFQYLVGMSKFWGRAVLRVQEAWSAVRASGLRVVLVEGNRDFFLDAKELAQQVDWCGRTYEFRSGPTLYRLNHGDRVNRRDVKYRFWAAVSKSRVSRAWAAVLPRRLAVAIVERMEARLATTNFRFRYRIPEEELQRAAQRAWDEGVDVMLWGHFHRMWELAAQPGRAMVVPAWLGTGHSLLVEADGSNCFVNASLTPCQPPRRMEHSPTGHC